MLEILPAEAWMASAIVPQKAQQLSGQPVTEAALANLLSHGFGLAAVKDEEICALAGIAQIWPGRGLAWAVLSDSMRANMVLGTRCALRGIANTSFQRVEAYVWDEHAEGKRWARMLGFSYEGTMRRFWGGQSAEMWALTRE